MAPSCVISAPRSIFSHLDLFSNDLRFWTLDLGATEEHTSDGGEFWVGWELGREEGLSGGRRTCVSEGEE